LPLENVNIGTVQPTVRKRKLRETVVTQVEHHRKDQAQNTYKGQAQPQQIVAKELFV